MRTDRVVEGPLGGEVLEQLGVVRRASSGTGPGRGTPCSVCSDGSRRRATFGGRLARPPTYRRRGSSRAAAGCSRAWRRGLAPDRQPPRHAAEDEGRPSPWRCATRLDSFNPFLGIVAPSFEVWALTYDYMIRYAIRTCRPKPGWPRLDDLGRRPDLDVRHP